MQRILKSAFPSLSLLALLSLSACNKKDSSSQAAQDPAPHAAEPSTQSPAAAAQPQEVTAKAVSVAQIGEAAPDFELQDLDGKTHKLSELKGKVVVLEWFNPSCPFVKASHTQGSLIDTAQRLSEQGVAYLAINSGGEGRQGFGVELNKAGAESFKINHPILLDPSGAVGHSYGATNTPHMFVIDQKGVLVYGGAVDNSPDGEAASPEGGTLVKYMEQAVGETLAGKAVSTPKTKAYGCGVKYAK